MDQTKSALKTLRPYWDDDIIDKLNYFWTALILIICTLTIGMKQYVGSPLQCWVPVEFKKYWEDYAEHYCFVENTYFVPMNETIPRTGQERVQRELGYYQWVPIVLALQAFMFVLPRLAWSTLNTQGFNVPAIMQAALEVKKDDKDKNQRLKGGKKVKEDVEFISNYIDETVKYRSQVANKKRAGHRALVNEDDIDPPYDTQHKPKGSWLAPVSLSTQLGGYYTTMIFLLMKLAYIANVIGQFFMMNRYLAPEYNWWGFGILNDLAHGREWHESGHFPRVTLCDFTIRKLGQLHTYTIQCVLILNMLNEKLYLFLWWWFLVVAILTILNLFYWLAISFSGSSRRNFVSRYLMARGKIHAPPSPQEKDWIKIFVDEYLRQDGILLLRLISANAGEIACANLVEQLWNLRYRKLSPMQSKIAETPEEGFIESPNSSLSGK